MAEQAISGPAALSGEETQRIRTRVRGVVEITSRLGKHAGSKPFTFLQQVDKRVKFLVARPDVRRQQPQRHFCVVHFLEQLVV